MDVVVAVRDASGPSASRAGVGPGLPALPADEVFDRALAELASAAAAVVTWLGVEHINRLGGQPLRSLEDFIEVPFQEAAVRPAGPAFG